MTTLTKKIPSKIAIIITAAGSSTRMGGSIKKEYLPYKNGTVLSVCAETFLNACYDRYEITDFIVTCPENGLEECSKALSPLSLLLYPGITLTTLIGSDTRQKSVFNALRAVSGNPEIVLIHDGARPFITEKLIVNAVEAAFEFGASVPGITPTDTQKEVDENGFIVRHLLRSSLAAVQTPQCFEYNRLLEAHNKARKDNREYTDDTEIWGAYCGRVKVIPGDVNNIKITYPSDLKKLTSGE